MKYSEGEILKALNTIKEVCDYNKICELCPFGESDTGSCYISDVSPGNWKLKQQDKEWKAFI